MFDYGADHSDQHPQNEDGDTTNQQDLRTAEEEENDRINYGETASSNHNYIFQKLAYRTKGIYINYIKNWYALFDKNAILIIDSNEYFHNPELTYKKVLDFLNLEDFIPESFNWKNKGEETTIPSLAREELKGFYRPYNKELFAFLGKDFNW